MQEQTSRWSCTVWRLRAAKLPVRGRVFLLHGLGHDHTMFEFPMYREFALNLVNNGWEVIAVDLPFAKDTAHLFGRLEERKGGSYSAEWPSYFNRVVVDIERKFGHVRRAGTVGISWGGLHALKLANAITNLHFYAAILPVIKVASLSEFAGLGKSAFDLNTGELGVGPKRIYIVWDTLDDRAPYKYAKEAFGEARSRGVKVDGREYAKYGHALSDEIFLDLVSWIR